MTKQIGDAEGVLKGVRVGEKLRFLQHAKHVSLQSPRQTAIGIARISRTNMDKNDFAKANDKRKHLRKETVELNHKKRELEVKIQLIKMRMKNE